MARGPARPQAAPVSVTAVGTDKRLARQYVDVPRRLYRDDPNWVPPLTSAALEALDRRKNPFHRHADVEHFVLFDDGEPVGRIAATVYPAYIERYGTKTGFFGFFEAPRDADAARQLLGAAEEWLAERGMERVAGPFNYCSTQEMGLLVEGFDQPPAAFQTYNPPWYRELIEGAGYEQAYGMWTVHWTAAEHAQYRPQVAEAGEAALERAGLTARPLSKRHYRRDMRTLRRLFNEAFADNHDVLPYEDDVFDHMVKPLKQLVDPNLITFLERDGEPVAFTAIVPDVNVILRELDGRLRLRDLPRVRRLQKDLRSAVMLIIGSLPETRGKGLGTALVAQMVVGLLDGGYEIVHTTWIHEENPVTAALVEHWNVEPDKHFAIFGRDL
jgi:GNAT superfamily N-acetyltransferase